ncbi:MAG: trypsin-like peptidase domain-containing protein [Planctomycetaceae bacterium]|nr:trypsin-like peptidase domain-containing protein [Planctomycetaceae bacterium]
MNSLSALVLTLSTLGGAPQGELLDFTATWCGPCQSVAPTVERLKRKGYPIRKVDVDKHPELAARYGVDSIPQFVLVIDGKPKQRLIGPQSEATLAGLMAQIPRGEPQHPEASAESKVAEDDRPLLRRGIPLPFLGKSKDISAEDVETVRAQNDDTTEAVTQKLDSGQSNSPTRNPMEAAVRLRVNQGGSINFGTGTIIESRPEYTLILSCGHIFRGADSSTRIAVDYYDGEEPTTWAGRLVRFNDKSDVGLVIVKPERVLPAVRISSRPDNVSKRELVFSIGCGNGEPPTRWQMFVKSVDQFVGSSIIECTQAPVSGRSGGGLFNRSGELIGVCMAADRKRNSGLYAGLKEVHKLLDASSLSALYRQPEETKTVVSDDRESTPRPMPREESVEEPMQTQGDTAASVVSRTHPLTDSEIDAIAAALQTSSRSGVTISIDNDPKVEEGYQIVISNRTELPERTVTKVALPNSSSEPSRGSQEQISTNNLQPGQTLAWDNLLDSQHTTQDPTPSNEQLLPAWAR